MAEHLGPIFKVTERRVYAYQDESVLVGGQFWLHANDPAHLDTHEWRSRNNCRSYRLRITNHTGSCVQVDLEVVPSEEEKQNGLKPWSYGWSGSFAELCNRLFGPGCEQ